MNGSNQHGVPFWAKYDETANPVIPVRSMGEGDHIRQQMEWNRIVKEAQKRIAVADRQDRKPREGRDL